MNIGARLGPASLQGGAMHSSLLLRVQAENEQVFLCNSGHVDVFCETPPNEKCLLWSSIRFWQLKKAWLRGYSQEIVEPVGLADVRRRISSLRKRPFLLALRRWRRKRKTRNVPSREEGGETDVFAGYRISQGGETESLIARENCQFAADVSAKSSFMKVTYVIA